jgi:Arc/MetJ family transcription regulator
MTKRLIEIDDEKLEAIRELLGTRTLRATVDGAFDEVLALDRRRRALLDGQHDGTGALEDPAARQVAWG